MHCGMSQTVSMPEWCLMTSDYIVAHQPSTDNTSWSDLHHRDRMMNEHRQKKSFTEILVLSLLRFCCKKTRENLFVYFVLCCCIILFVFYYFLKNFCTLTFFYLYIARARAHVPYAKTFTHTHALTQNNKPQTYTSHTHTTHTGTHRHTRTQAHTRTYAPSYVHALFVCETCNKQRCKSRQDQKI